MKTALVLSGGGAKGAFQAGVIKALADRGISFDCVAGVSVGALNGVMVASNQIERMIDLWQTITEKQVLKKRSIVGLLSRLGLYKIGIASPPKSIYSNDPLFNLLKTEFWDIAMTIPITIGRVNIETGRYVSDINTGQNDFPAEVLASTAIPVVWEPVSIDDGMFVDGGVRNTTPIKDVIKHQPDRIILIPNRPLNGQIENKAIRSIIDIAERTLDILLDEIFIEDIKRCMQINRLVMQAEEQGVTLMKDSGEIMKHYELIIIEPPEPLRGTLNFDREHLDTLLLMGKEAAHKALGEQSDTPIV